jgi:hypothetical protein
VNPSSGMMPPLDIPMIIAVTHPEDPGGSLLSLLTSSRKTRSQKNASTRDGAPVPRTSFKGATTISAPEDGSASTLASCVRP